MASLSLGLHLLCAFVVLAEEAANFDVQWYVRVITCGWVLRQLKLPSMFAEGSDVGSKAVKVKCLVNLQCNPAILITAAFLFYFEKNVQQTQT